MLKQSRDYVSSRDDFALGSGLLDAGAGVALLDDLQRSLDGAIVRRKQPFITPYQGLQSDQFRGTKGQINSRSFLCFSAFLSFSPCGTALPKFLSRGG